MEKKTYLPLAKALAERRNNAETGLGCYHSERKEFITDKIATQLDPVGPFASLFFKVDSMQPVPINFITSYLQKVQRQLNLQRFKLSFLNLKRLVLKKFRWTPNPTNLPQSYPIIKLHQP